MKKNITAVCISGKEEPWNTPDILFYCHTQGYRKFPHYPPAKTRERIRYLSSRRNAANRVAVELYPETQHFLSIDSYYVHYVTEIRRLVNEYSAFKPDCILGATNWFWDHSRLPLRLRYWDTWATPEMKNTPYEYYPTRDGLPEGWERIAGCGGFTLYPRWVWEKQGYGIPEPFPQAGNEVNYLCQCPGIASYVTFNVKPLRETPRRSLVNRVRTTLGLRTRLGLKRHVTLA
jgi:hypothetical protein